MKLLINARFKSLIVGCLTLILLGSASEQLLAATGDSDSCQPNIQFNPIINRSGVTIPNTKPQYLYLYSIDSNNVLDKIAALHIHIIDGQIKIIQLDAYNKSFPLNFIESLIPVNGKPGLNISPLRDWVESAACKVSGVYAVLYFQGEKYADMRFDLLLSKPANDLLTNYQINHFTSARVTENFDGTPSQIRPTSSCNFSVDCIGEKCGNDPLFDPVVSYGDNKNGNTESEVSIYVGDHNEKHMLVGKFSAVVNLGAMYLTGLKEAGTCYTKEFLKSFLVGESEEGKVPMLPSSGINMASFATHLGKCGFENSFLILGNEKQGALFINPHKLMYNNVYDFSNIEGLVEVPDDDACEGDIIGDIVSQSCSCSAETPSPSPVVKPSAQPSAEPTSSAEPSPIASPVATDKPVANPTDKPIEGLPTPDPGDAGGACQPDIEQSRGLALFDNRIKNYADFLAKASRQVARFARNAGETSLAKEFSVLAAQQQTAGIRLWTMTWQNLGQELCRAKSEISTCVSEGFSKTYGTMQTEIDQLTRTQRSTLRELRKRQTEFRFKKIRKRIVKARKMAFAAWQDLSDKYVKGNSCGRAS